MLHAASADVIHTCAHTHPLRPLLSRSNTLQTCDITASMQSIRDVQSLTSNLLEGHILDTPVTAFLANNAPFLPHSV